MVRLNKIYTRTGDDGTSGLVDGSRASKESARFEAMGAVDEANSTLGWAALACDGSEQAAQFQADLRRIQNDLFDLGADLATPDDGQDFAPSPMVLRIVPEQVAWLEGAIDALNAELAPLTSFILPGGSEASARVHMARACVRRAERACVALYRDEGANPAAIAYINRLSDYLFVLARTLNDKGRADVLWTPGANR